MQQNISKIKDGFVHIYSTSRFSRIGSNRSKVVYAVVLLLLLGRIVSSDGVSSSLRGLRKAQNSLQCNTEYLEWFSTLRAAEVATLMTDMIKIYQWGYQKLM